MEFALRQMIERQFSRMENLKSEYISEGKKLKQSEELYSPNEILKRKLEFKNKFIERAETYVKEVAEYAAIYTEKDKALVALNKSQKDENFSWLSVDMTTFLNCNLSDSVAFETVRRYLGDFAIMKRFLCIDRFNNSLSSVDYPITTYALNYCKKIDFTAQEVVNDYIKLLCEFKRKFAYSDTADLGNGLQEAYLRKSLENDVDKYETLLIQLQNIKTASFESIQNSRDFKKRTVDEESNNE